MRPRERMCDRQAQERALWPGIWSWGPGGRRAEGRDQPTRLPRTPWFVLMRVKGGGRIVARRSRVRCVPERRWETTQIVLSGWEGERAERSRER